MWVLGRARGHCMWSLGTSAIMKKKSLFNNSHCHVLLIINLFSGEGVTR